MSKTTNAKGGNQMANNNKFIGHHGDLDFIQVDELPKGAKKIGTFRTHVAQEGETTGHKHVITSSKEFDLYQFEQKQENGEIIKRWAYLLSAPAEISHEEHAIRVLEPGMYIQDQENEEDPWADLIVRVVD